MPDNNPIPSWHASGIADLTLSPEQSAILVLLARVEALELAVTLLRGGATLPRVKMKKAAK